MLTGRPVTVMDMSYARENRVRRREKLMQMGKTVVSFSLNIPGEIKDAPVLRRVFVEGERRLCELLRPSYQKRWEEFTGWQGLYLCDRPAERVKTEMIILEENHPLGRLFDLDVFSADGKKLSRPQYRKCFLCGRQAQICARSRAHNLSELTAAAEKIAVDYFYEEDAKMIGALAEQALLYEVSVTPKPGLVDRKNNGSHQDMDLWTFLKSASALRETFVRCAKAGMREQNPVSLFCQLRQIGICGEADMLQATDGVNTHKGAVFSLGLLCGAIGHSVAFSGDPVETVKQMSSGFLQAEQIEAGGFGGQLFRMGMCGGIRMEAALGYPSVTKIAVPVFQRALQQGASENDAGVLALLALIGTIEDTNMIHRAGEKKAAQVRDKIAQEYHHIFSMEDALKFAEKLDQEFIAENLSPGGCADLLAVTWLIIHVQKYRYETCL